MRIILTHEQADFDALASLLGAYLLDETAFPVLPSRMNRNVRAFLTLYGMELPFVERRDLPGKPVQGITLVDTQSLITVKGMGPQTRVRVIDHHDLRETLPASWEVTIDQTGANATLFVEALREHNGPLTTIQSTLLLLGIYEDTGSLTYSRTSARDLRAAGYLVEQGASLKIAGQYLNHPLSPQQQALYERLRSSFESHQVHGNTVIVACGDALDMEEEISTIAHKLRDLLDPDGLFLLITTRSGVQMIARSTSDRLDVSEITDQFGGGGHSRAAAALIKGQAIEEVRSQLLEMLPRFIYPAITVSQIMSRGPQLLTPDVSAEEAAQRMQRYGYEGYPVVQGDRVVGLLTRRAVDRAIAHKLNLTAASLMEAGEVSVSPTDSIEELQRRMIDSGWGQVPVVQPESGKIIGIVTRTDLLNILTSRKTHADPQNLADKLERALPKARLALLKAVAHQAYEQRSALYIVGGFVRDLLLDRPSLDFDLVVEGDAIALGRALVHEYGGRVTSHSRFGTAKWFVPAGSMMEPLGVEVLDGLPGSVDLISARTEFYTHPTALPTVERGSIKLDLHRRDFTINTLALRLDGHHYGELHDYWGGLSDLRQGWVRVLHSLSFVDDPTRILRAVRFEQRFAFQIEERTLQLLKEALSLLDRVSGDRIRHELDHMLDEDPFKPMLARLQSLEVLKTIHPGLVWDSCAHKRLDGLNLLDHPVDGDASALQRFLENDLERDAPAVRRGLAYILWFLCLEAEHVPGVLSRLKTPRDLADDVVAARSLWKELALLPNMAPSLVVSRLDGLPPRVLAAVYLAVEEPRVRQVLQAYVSQWSQMAPTITGYDLRARGLPPGPLYRQILETLRSAWLDGQVTSAEEEQVLLETLIERGLQDSSLET